MHLPKHILLCKIHSVLIVKLHNKIFGKKFVFEENDILEMLTTTPAYYAFDLDQKGFFDSGKKANFLVLNKIIGYMDCFCQH